MTRDDLRAWLVGLLAACLLLAGLPAAQAAVGFRGASSTSAAEAGIHYVGSGSVAGFGSCGSIAPTVPAGQPGDLLIALVALDSPWPTITMPGWNAYLQDTEIVNFILDGYQVAVFWRIATGFDVALVNQSPFLFFVCGNMTSQVARFRGVAPGNPFDGSPGVSAQNSNQVSTGSVTTTVPDTMTLVASFVMSNRKVSPGAGWTEAFDSSLWNTSVALSYRPQATPGTFSVSNWSLNGNPSTYTYGAILALRPEPSGLTVNRPAGTVANDVMIASIAVSPGPAALTPPAGWVPIGKVDQPGPTSSTLASFYKVATAAEPASYTWTLDGAHQGAAGGIASFSDVDTAAPIDAYAGAATGNSTDHTAPTVDLSVAGGMLVTVHEFASSKNWTTPAGMSAAVNIASHPLNQDPGVSLAVNYEARASAGPTGSRTASAPPGQSRRDFGATQSIALKPGGVAVPSIDHIRILHDGEALTCAPEEVTLLACLDADCTSLYLDSVTTTLSPAGWVGGDTVTFSNGSVTRQLRRTTPGVVTLGSGSTSPAPANPTRCQSGSGSSCALEFFDTGFTFDVPDLQACQASPSVALRAVRKDKETEGCVADASFRNTSKTLRFWSGYLTASKEDRPVVVNGTPVASGAPGTGLTLAFDANASASLSVSYDDAGGIALSARYQGSGGDAGLLMQGSDSFVVRPHGFGLAALSADGATALDNTGSGAGAHWAAGEPFRQRLQAQCANGSLTPSYVPGNAQLLVQVESPAAAPSSGSLSLKGIGLDGSPAASPVWRDIGALFTDGRVSEGSGLDYAWASYSEVGVIRLRVRDGNYLGAGIPESALVVGRFRPHHFTTAVDQEGEFANACGSFSYSGQEFGYLMDETDPAAPVRRAPRLLITPKNRDGVVTQNYRDDFMKLAVGGVVIERPLADASQEGAEAGEPPVEVDVVAGPATLEQLDPDDPVLTYTLGDDRFRYRKTTNARLPPFSADLRLAVNQVQDSDGVSASDLGSREFRPTGAELRYGRMVMQNTYGSELLDREVPLLTQYFTGAGFQVNGADSCTRYDAGDVILAFGTPASQPPSRLGPGETEASGAGELSDGRATAPPLRLKAPGAGNEGWVDLTMCLSATTPACAAHPGISSERPWLLDDDGREPTARVTFGIYRGSENMIYMREQY